MAQQDPGEVGTKTIEEHIHRPVFLILSSLHLPFFSPHPCPCVPNWENQDVVGSVVGVRVRERTAEGKLCFGTGG